MGLKVKESGVFTDVGGDTGWLESISEGSIMTALPGVDTVSETEIANTVPLTVSESGVVDLAVAFIGVAVGSLTASASSFSVSARPTGTASGDTLHLNFIGGSNTAPTITGWTLKSGPDAVGSMFGFLYERVADMTATDLPTVTYAIGGTGSGYALIATRSSTTVGIVGSVATDTTGGTTTTFTGASITTSGPALVIASALFVASAAFSGLSGGFDRRYDSAATNNVVASKWVPAAGPSGVPVIAIAVSRTTHIVYTFAIA